MHFVVITLHIHICIFTRCKLHVHYEDIVKLHQQLSINMGGRYDLNCPRIPIHTLKAYFAIYNLIILFILNFTCTPKARILSILHWMYLKTGETRITTFIVPLPLCKNKQKTDQFVHASLHQKPYHMCSSWYLPCHDNGLTRSVQVSNFVVIAP